jgi:hypothetical protein
VLLTASVAASHSDQHEPGDQKHEAGSSAWPPLRSYAGVETSHNGPTRNGSPRLVVALTHADQGKSGTALLTRTLRPGQAEMTK